MHFTDTVDVIAEWFSLWDSGGVFVGRPVLFDLQLTVEQRGAVQGRVSFDSALFLSPNSSLDHGAVFQVRFGT